MKWLDALQARYHRWQVERAADKAAAKSAQQQSDNSGSVRTPNGSVIPAAGSHTAAANSGASSTSAVQSQQADIARVVYTLKPAAVPPALSSASSSSALSPHLQSGAHALSAVSQHQQLSSLHASPDNENARSSTTTRSASPTSLPRECDSPNTQQFYATASRLHSQQQPYLGRHTPPPSHLRPSSAGATLTPHRLSAVDGLPMRAAASSSASDGSSNDACVAAAASASSSSSSSGALTHSAAAAAPALDDERLAEMLQQQEYMSWLQAEATMESPSDEAVQLRLQQQAQRQAEKEQRRAQRRLRHAERERARQAAAVAMCIVRDSASSADASPVADSRSSAAASGADVPDSLRADDAPSALQRMLAHAHTPSRFSSSSSGSHVPTSSASFQTPTRSHPAATLESMLHSPSAFGRAHGGMLSSSASRSHLTRSGSLSAQERDALPVFLYSPSSSSAARRKATSDAAAPPATLAAADLTADLAALTLSSSDAALPAPSAPSATAAPAAVDTAATESCSICLSDFELNDKIRCLPACLHRYHRACIDDWLGRSSLCPECNTDVRAAF